MKRINIIWYNRSNMNKHGPHNLYKNFTKTLTRYKWSTKMGQLHAVNLQQQNQFTDEIKVLGMQTGRHCGCIQELDSNMLHLLISSWIGYFLNVFFQKHIFKVLRKCLRKTKWQVICSRLLWHTSRPCDFHRNPGKAANLNHLPWDNQHRLIQSQKQVVANSLPEYDDKKNPHVKSHNLLRKTAQYATP